MGYKLKNTKQNRTKRRAHIKRKTKRSIIKQRRVTRRRLANRMKGGNYEKDFTTRTLENMPVKPLNKVVVTVPGRGTMSASSYIKLMEDLDRNGDQYYD